MNNISERKTALRKEMQRLRDGLAPEEVLDKSNRIQHFFDSLKFENLPQDYMSYVSIGNEAGTIGIIKKLLETNKKVSVPVCVPATTQLIASLILDLDELVPSRFGLMEPKKDLIRPIGPRGLDIVLVPGLAFDRHCNRLGYGKGYYDRFLTKISPNALKVGLAYSFQIVEQIPKDYFDIPLDIIITEKEIIYS